MEPTDIDRAAERRRICARLEELQGELNTLEARLQELGPAPEQRPRVLRSQIQIVAAAKPEGHGPAPVQVVAGAERQPPADPLDLLRGLARGAALFVPADGAGGPADVVLLVRGDSQRFAALGEAPDVQLRAGVMTLPEAAVALVPVVVRLGSAEEPENLYEACVNQSAAGLEATLLALASQERLVVYLHGDDCRLVRVLSVPNPLRAFARAALPLVGSLRPLSVDELHQARAAIYHQHPTVRSLWRALQAS
jgi:hypothetical protein